MVDVREQKMEIVARWNDKGNTKLGNILSWSTLAGDGEFDTPYGVVSGTCGGCCEGCGHAAEGRKRPPCYVFKSYRHGSVIKGHARNTLAVREDADKAFRDLSDHISRKRNPVIACRYDQSGSFENGAVFRYMCRCAAEHPTIPFFVYTKRYGIVVEALENGEVPANLFILFSIWHENGIAEYLRVSQYPNVKAFVYCDKNKHPFTGWDEDDYAKKGIVITTFCKAYDTKGKMNHAITCEKCRKCYVARGSWKTIACWDHA